MATISRFELAVLRNFIIVGDKGYISRLKQINLFETARIESEVQLRCY